MEVEKLKQLLAINDDKKDAVLEFIMEDVEETIKNYCNINKIPDELLHTAYRMAIDLYQYGNAGGEETPLAVSSVSIGGTSTSFSNATDAIKETILSNYEEQLNRYRRLVW